MELNNFKAVVFDLDNTLIHSTIDFKKMKRKVIEVFNCYGVETFTYHTSLKIMEIIKISTQFLRDKGLDVSEVSAVLSEINDIMDNVELEKVDETIQIQYAINTLQELKKQGIKIGVVTRGCKKYALKALRTVDMLEYIDTLFARDDSSKPKPDPQQLLKAVEALNVENDETIMVGDSTLDAMCAKSAGVKFIGVLTGSTNKEELIQIGCLAILPDITSII